MASTVTLNSDEFEGFKFGTLTLGTYATNGIAVTGAQVDCPQNLVQLIVHPSGGYVFEYVASTGKVKAYRQKDPAAAGGADIPLPEVAAGVDLSSVNAPFTAFGY